MKDRSFLNDYPNSFVFGCIMSNSRVFGNSVGSVWEYCRKYVRLPNGCVLSHVNLF